jgi:glycosyltransferase involved in cell wall biosynthesis
MKVVVQIPCLNEELTIDKVIDSIPKKIPGVDKIVILLIDDGSTDKSVAIAKAHGVTEFIHHTQTVGLGRTFHDGVMRALELDADIVVNTDADNQHPQEMISELVASIVAGKADIVIGNRGTQSIEYFSPLKKWLQKTGTKVVNAAAGTDVPDAASGFRAYSRESLMQINTVTRFSYTMETIIQAGNKGLAIASVPIVAKKALRPSRLFKSMHHHVLKSASAIIRAYIMYNPFTVFASIAIIMFVLGLIPFVRFLFFALQGERGQHTLSLLLGLLFWVSALLAGAIGILADLIRTNRILNELALENLKRTRFKGKG